MALVLSDPFKKGNNSRILEYLQYRCQNYRAWRSAAAPWWCITLSGEADISSTYQRRPGYLGPHHPARTRGDQNHGEGRSDLCSADIKQRTLRPTTHGAH